MVGTGGAERRDKAVESRFSNSVTTIPSAASFLAVVSARRS